MKTIPSFLAAALLSSALAAAALAQSDSPVVSAEPTVFREVAAKLDAGGSLYGYMSTDQWLGKLSSKIAEVRSFVLGVPDLAGEKRAVVESVFTLIEGLAKRTGIESIAGVGVSGIAVEKGLYRTRFVLQRGPGTTADGYFWHWFGRQPHALSWLDWLPADTVYAVNTDLDLHGIWTTLAREAETAKLEPLKAAMAGLSANLKEGTGSSLEEHLESLGGEIGVALVLDPSRTFKLPLPEGATAELPEPSLVIALKVKDDKLFNFIENVLSQNPESTRGEADGGRWRSIPVPSEAPFPVKPTIGRAGDYLWIASTDTLLPQILKVHAGAAPALKNSAELKRLAKGLPTEGNSFAFAGQRFSETLTRLQQAMLDQVAREAGGPPPATMLMMQRMFGMANTPAAFTVGWQGKDASQSVTQGTQEPSLVLVAAAVVAPVAVMAGITLPALAKAKGKAQDVMCLNNLKQIGLAMHMYATDHDDTFPPDLKSLKTYLGTTRVLICPTDPAGMPASGDWSEFDFSKSSYEFLKPGIKTGDESPTTPLARCKFHGSVVLIDGSAHRSPP